MDELSHNYLKFLKNTKDNDEILPTNQPSLQLKNVFSFHIKFT